MTAARPPLILPWRVGDRALVRRACLSNPPDSIALCVEVYTLNGQPWSPDGLMLLFANGQHDGFSQADLGLFHVQRGDRLPAFADYKFTTVADLLRDFRTGLFARAWSSLIRGSLTPSLTPVWNGYPLERWPACPSCGEPALDDHLTCGQDRCGPEARWR